MAATGTLFMISAPSGAGKTTLVQSLIGCVPRIRVSVSHTTRPIRPQEIAGVSYHFVDEAQFLDMKAAHAFVESAKVFGHYYGTSKAWVNEQLTQGTDVILEIDWQGARIIRQHFNDAISIFVLPPSRHALHNRLIDRQQDSPAVIARRMQQAVNEMSHCSEYDYLIVNDELEQAVESLRTIVVASRLSYARQNAHHTTLLVDLLRPAS